MSKKLSEMSLEELWQLFPIFLTEHQDYWKDWYAEEKTLLKPLLPQTAKLNHIGSTAGSLFVDNKQLTAVKVVAFEKSWQVFRFCININTTFVHMAKIINYF